MRQQLSKPRMSLIIACDDVLSPVGIGIWQHYEVLWKLSVVFAEAIDLFPRCWVSVGKLIGGDPYNWAIVFLMERPNGRRQSASTIGPDIWEAKCPPEQWTWVFAERMEEDVKHCHA